MSINKNSYNLFVPMHEKLKYFTQQIMASNILYFNTLYRVQPHKQSIFI